MAAAAPPSPFQFRSLPFPLPSRPADHYPASSLQPQPRPQISHPQWLYFAPPSQPTQAAPFDPALSVSLYPRTSLNSDDLLYNLPSLSNPQLQSQQTHSLPSSTINSPLSIFPHSPVHSKNPLPLCTPSATNSPTISFPLPLQATTAASPPASLQPSLSHDPCLRSTTAAHLLVFLITTATATTRRKPQTVTIRADRDEEESRSGKKRA